MKTPEECILEISKNKRHCGVYEFSRKGEKYIFATDSYLLVAKPYPEINSDLGNKFNSFPFPTKTVEDLVFDMKAQTGIFLRKETLLKWGGRVNWKSRITENERVVCQMLEFQFNPNLISRIRRCLGNFLVAKMEILNETPMLRISTNNTIGVAMGLTQGRTLPGNVRDLADYLSPEERISMQLQGFGG